MSLNKNQTTGTAILSITLLSVLVLNLYFLELNIFGWFGPVFFGLALGGFLISLIFFFLANRHFKDSTTHHSNTIVGWVCIGVFIALNIGANYIGLDELARIKHW